MAKKKLDRADMESRYPSLQKPSFCKKKGYKTLCKSIGRTFYTPPDGCVAITEIREFQNAQKLAQKLAMDKHSTFILQDVRGQGMVYNVIYSKCKGGK